ncbi:hypothetical protein ES703_101788 [subsurface metagenome]
MAGFRTVHKMSNLLKVFLVVGARPNFMKMAPLYLELVKEKGVKTSTVHTGQHYEEEIVDVVEDSTLV